MVVTKCTELIPCNVKYRKDKWINFADGCFYGIPFKARKVLQYIVEDESIKEILDLILSWRMDLDQEGIGTVFELVMEVFTVFLFGVWKKMWNIFLKITPVEIGDADVEILEEELPECEYYS